MYFLTSGAYFSNSLTSCYFNSSGYILASCYWSNSHKKGASIQLDGKRVSPAPVGTKPLRESVSSWGQAEKSLTLNPLTSNSSAQRKLSTSARRNPRDTRGVCKCSTVTAIYQQGARRPAPFQIPLCPQCSDLRQINQLCPVLQPHDRKGASQTSRPKKERKGGKQRGSAVHGMAQPDQVRVSAGATAATQEKEPCKGQLHPGFLRWPNCTRLVNLGLEDQHSVP